MTTVERVINFAETWPEEDGAPAERGSPPTPKTGSWPHQGRIEWRGVVCCYPGGKGVRALDGVWLTVEAGVCLGVCGRTGRADLLSALFCL